MGMIGNYLAVHAELLQSIRTEEVSLHEIGPKLDIDKSWQALHYILNGGQEGNSSPLGAAVPLTSHYIGHYSDAEVFALEPDEVKLTAEALEGIEEAWLREHYPFRQMMEEGVYPLWRRMRRKNSSIISIRISRPSGSSTSRQARVHPALCSIFPSHSHYYITLEKGARELCADMLLYS